MYIDVIVPSFDESGEDVLISTWYKKVGDKISNGEVIADAETSTIACGITSGYDCFLSKIIVKEGELVPQGSKIAVIEVDVTKPSSGTSRESIRETAEEELKNIHVSPEAEKEAQEGKKTENASNGTTPKESLQREAEASRAERRQALKDMENGKISAEEIERRRARREALQNIERVVQDEIKKEEKIEKEEDEYTLSVASDNVSDDLVAETIKDIIDEEKELTNEKLTEDEIFEREEEIAEQEEFIEEEMKNSEKEDMKRKKSMVESFAEQAEKQFKNILKDAESQAQKEADKLRDRIIEDAKVSALAESEVMKAKILRKYEDKAAKDAGEMHKKIIQGSISEAQNTRTKLIEEAKAEAIKEAEAIKSKIKEEAQEAAEKEASIIKQNSLLNAEKEAKEEADKISKEIIEKAIDESKAEANEIKKDIIKSAGRHAKKESEQLIRDELRHARKESQLKSEEIMAATIFETKKNADEIKEEILNKTKAGVNEVMDNMMQSVLAEGRTEINKSEDLKAQIAETMRECVDQAENTKNKVIDEISQSREATIKEINENKNQIVGGLKESIDHALSVKEKLAAEMATHTNNADRVRKKLNEEIKINIEQIANIREKLIGEMQNNINQIISARKKLVEEISESKKDLLQSIKESIDHAVSVKQKLSREMREDIDQVIRTKEKLSEELNENIDKAINVKEKLNEEIHKNIDQNLILKNEILEEIRRCYNKMCNDMSNCTRKTANEITKEILIGADKKIQEIENIETEKKNIDEEVSVQNLKEKEDEIIEKLLNIKEDDGGTPEMYADNWNKPKFFYSPDDKRENIDFLRQRISEKMKDAYDSSVIATVSNEVDMSTIISLEKAFGEAFSKKYNTRLGFTPFFIMAAVEALKCYKVFNAHIHEDEIIYKNHFDISVITCGNDGIAAPVIRQADKLNFAEIEKKMIALSRRAIEGTLSIEEVSNGTFTVVNAGMYGSLMGTDILTPPQVATLSVHKMHNRPVATNDGVEIRPMLYVSLSYDHRIADTKLAAEFLSHIKNYAENPGWQLLGL